MNDRTFQVGEMLPGGNTLNNIGDVRLFELPRYARDDGVIVVAQATAQVPFKISRMFTVTAPVGARRGDHAHRRCTQLMFCVHGNVEVICDDGRTQQSFVLDRNNLALCVPPTIWNAIVYHEGGSVLAVLCDRPFEESDYLRTYADFVAYRKENS
jgi:dTDP-4-dehydrorhamnose 3,5-epimerase-like enzyme